MADWLDTADKVSSIVGAVAGVTAVVIAIQNKRRHEAPAVERARWGWVPTALSAFWHVLPAMSRTFAYCAAVVLAAGWWLARIGDGSMGPWWLLAGLTVCAYAIATHVRYSPEAIRLYALWIPAVTWLTTRAVTQHWIPDLGGEGAKFVFIAVAVLSTLVGIVRTFSRR